MDCDDNKKRKICQYCCKEASHYKIHLNDADNIIELCKKCYYIFKNNK